VGSALRNKIVWITRMGKGKGKFLIDLYERQVTAGEWHRGRGGCGKDNPNQKYVGNMLYFINNVSPSEPQPLIQDRARGRPGGIKETWGGGEKGIHIYPKDAQKKPKSEGQAKVIDDFTFAPRKE